MDTTDDGHRPLADRKRLFEPGHYSSIPDVILRMTGLTATAKLVWMVLARYLFRAVGTPWPSTSVLASETGSSRDAAMNAVRLLEEVDLLGIERVAGMPNTYRLFQPDAADAEATANQWQKATSGKKPPVAKTDRTCSKKPPLPVAKTDCPYKECTSSTDTKDTPLPPQAGDGRADFKNGETATQEIIRDLDVACMAVFGTRTPNRWRRRLERMNGEASLFAGVTAQDIRAAQAKAAGQKRSFGFGWLENHLRDKAAAVLTRNAANQRKAEADARRVMDELERQQTQRYAAQQRQDYFASLSEADKGRYREVARRKPFASKRADLLDAEAAILAWKERPAGATA